MGDGVFRGWKGGGRLLGEEGLLLLDGRGDGRVAAVSRRRKERVVGRKVRRRRGLERVCVSLGGDVLAGRGVV